MADNERSEIPEEPAERVGGWTHIWERLVRLGLGETTLRIGTSVISIALFLIVIWVMGAFYVKGPTRLPQAPALVAAVLPTASPAVPVPAFEVAGHDAWLAGITRLAHLHTSLPSRPRFEITKYTVQEGDNLFDIATKFSLNPRTLLWGNYAILADNPEFLKAGQVLNILPVDGVLYQWNTGDGLNGVAKFFGVSVDDIIDYPGNHLSRDSLGDLASPNIPKGTSLIIPGGTRDFNSWTAPRVVRTDPSTGKSIGVGACGQVVQGAVGIGSFIWPTTERFISGYNFSPETNHPGIDIGGRLGNPIYASDNGVVVYSGWSDLGYGNLVIIDHGNGWQTLYAHLSVIYVDCGQSLYQGAQIGEMGSTGNSSGPHLHFEMRSDTYGKVNPLNYAQ